MSIQSEFQQLSIAEKVQLVQDLWDQIATTPETVSIPPWHRSELQHRQNEWSTSPDPGQDWDVVKRRLRASL